MKNFKNKKTIATTTTLAGFLNDDATVITIMDDDDNEVEIEIAEALKPYITDEAKVKISVSLKVEEELDVEV